MNSRYLQSLMEVTSYCLDYIIDTLGDKEIEKEVKCLKNGGKLLRL